MLSDRASSTNSPSDSSATIFASVLTLVAAERPARLRLLIQALALLLVALGVLLRPNAIFAAPFLAAYAVWPTRFDVRRMAIIFLPAVVLSYALVPLVYYGLLDAKRQNPLHSIMVFDLGGTTHFTGENQFPVTWSAEQTALLTSKCYDPVRWDSYWHVPPCPFVMQRLERPDDIVFGTARLVAAWWQAVYSPLGVFFLLTFISMCGLMLFANVFGLYALERFGYGPKEVGWIMMALGLTSALGQGTLVGPLTKRWGNLVIVKISLLATVAGFGLMVLANTFVTILLASAFFGLATALQIPALTSLTSQRSTVPQGVAMGLNEAFVSLGRIVGPLLGGIAFDINISLPYLSGAAIMLIGLLVSFVGISHKTDDATILRPA